MVDFVIFFTVGVLFVIGAFVASWLIAPHKPSAAKLSTYECGEEPVGGSWIQFNPRYYLFALAFVIFDVEILFLAPTLLVMRSFGFVAFIEIFIFLFILILGLSYIWRKGALEWM
ncbi:NAD(P)H-quinone oxidoreductase subunit 3 [candidate division WOR-1 bacterium RIFCSPHIGHO2_01_FULL_53_15]|uniref:NADH-quinone oxidoreductase subunit n=1 Tax=candidate division WOR-1 bacterium RIFCSPHIGHO2_01_FULL_53_15 TaxID=1802564 RepID=A0A1F4Q489_UNCSA|nr:MAG: NAD(P)H-quinone oxidoreductase subunit 3 [candidate division WOR-1 bacterium RIFCSPHIGHO2_01_FULL_53_15]OGC12727.1 MAG: NAD(P)H-quinone oxidoreductase subunit 3 [candidate division WOR-1 bacterium RIFCSPHIGHO2_02_FULL_53_26]